MTTREIFEHLAVLKAMDEHLAEEYILGGGEITATTEQIEAERAAVAALLTTEGVDSLGRWLKAKQSEADDLRAEAAKVKRLRDANAKTIDHIRQLVGDVLRATGQERVKGTLYTFKQYTSDTCKADAAVLKERYQATALKAIHDAGIPGCVTVTLGASAGLVPEGQELPDFFVRTVTPTASMVAPRKAEEDA